MRQKKKKERGGESGALQGGGGTGSLSRSRVRHGGSNPFLGRSGSANEFPRNVSRIEKGVAVDFFRDFFPSGTGLRAHGDSTAVLVSYSFFLELDIFFGGGGGESVSRRQHSF